MTTIERYMRALQRAIDIHVEHVALIPEDELLECIDAVDNGSAGIFLGVMATDEAEERGLTVAEDLPD